MDLCCMLVAGNCKLDKGIHDSSDALEIDEEGRWGSPLGLSGADGMVKLRSDISTGSEGAGLVSSGINISAETK